jgi:hypothetical protein
MKKRILSLLLSLTLLAGLAMPAAAAGTGMENFAEKKATYSGFSDVASDAWYGQALRSCYESKLMQGTTPTTFNPQGSLTVAAAVVMAARTRSVYEGGSGSFPSVEGAPWYQSALDYALEEGILTESVLPLFDFSKPVTRAQMAYLFARALPAAELPEINAVTWLPDVKESDTFGKEIFQLYRAGALMGSDRYGTFNPNSTITRAAACAIMARVAFPYQRSVLKLYQRYTEGVLSFDMPAGSTRQETDSGTEYVAPDQTDFCLVTRDVNPYYKGLSISVLPADLLEELMNTSFAEAGLTVRDMTISLVKFSTLEAYRVRFTAEVSDVQLLCCAYFTISGDTMTAFVAVTGGGEKALTMVANSVTVGGSPVSPKI